MKTRTLILGLLGLALGIVLKSLMCHIIGSIALR